MMRYRRLGRTGLQVSELGFGCGSTAGLFTDQSEDAQRAATRLALDGGVTLFDTAFRYGAGRSETNLGRTLRALGDPDVVVASKLRVERSHLDDIVAAVREMAVEALQRLGRNHLDLVQLHNRVAVEDVLEPEYAGVLSLTDLDHRGVTAALRALVAEGLARFIGFSGIGEPEAVRAVIAGGEYDTVQLYYNLLNPSAGMRVTPGFRYIDYAQAIALAHEHDVGVLAIRALAGGALAEGPPRPAGAGSWGVWARGELTADHARAPKLAQLCRPDETLSQAAIRFVLADARVGSVLVGFTSPEDVLAALTTLDGPVDFSDSERAALRASLEFS